MSEVVKGASLVQWIPDKDRQEQLTRELEVLTKTVSVMERVQSKGVREKGFCVDEMLAKANEAADKMVDTAGKHFA